MLNFAKRIFTRKVRASLYGASVAAVAALVVSGDLPAWASPVAAPFLLALLNLSPSDVDEPKRNEDGTVEPGSLALGLIGGFALAYVIWGR